MLTIEKAILLESVEHFDVVDSERLGAIAAIAEEVVYAAGDVIYEADDASDAMYLVVDGEVVDSTGKDHRGRLVGDATIVSDPERGRVLKLGRKGDYVGQGECVPYARYNESVESSSP